MPRAGRPAIAALPLVLAGPIVRRATTADLAVWIALHEPRDVFVSVKHKGSMIRSGPITRTVRLGDRLHVALARVEGMSLAPNTRYDYDVTLAKPHTPPQSMMTGAVANAATALCLAGRTLPSFVAPPGAIDEIDLVHGSCRKPHGPAPDTLARLAAILDHEHPGPQQLLLTGDQIYADDVAGPLLAAIVELADELFGTGPTTRAPIRAKGRALGEAELAPYQRYRALSDTLAMKGDLSCHLARFEEFAAMYLMVWSPAVWPAQLPAANEVGAIVRGRPGTVDDPATYDGEATLVSEFVAKLPAVRRALANIATYMIIDDHEVSDDLFIDQQWTKAVLGDPDGKAIVRHALAAYAVFQAWGNDPAAIQPVISAIAKWRAKPTPSTTRALDAVLGLPAGKVLQDGQIKRDKAAVRWSYAVPGPVHRLAVLDTRTRRVFTGDRMALVPPGELARAVSPPGAGPAQVAIVVSPSPLVEPEAYELARWAGRNSPSQWIRRTADAEMWLADPAAMEALLDALFAEARAVVLSGDVHYGFAATVDRAQAGTVRHVPCFIASPLMNAFEGSLKLGLGVGSGPPVPQFTGYTRYGKPILDNHLGRVRIKWFDGVLAASHTWYIGADGTRTLNLAF